MKLTHHEDMLLVVVSSPQTWDPSCTRSSAIGYQISMDDTILDKGRLGVKMFLLILCIYIFIFQCCTFCECQWCILLVRWITDYLTDHSWMVSNGLWTLWSAAPEQHSGLCSFPFCSSYTYNYQSNSELCHMQKYLDWISLWLLDSRRATGTRFRTFWVAAGPIFCSSTSPKPMTQRWTSDRKDRSSNFKLDLRSFQCGGGWT